MARGASAAKAADDRVGPIQLSDRADRGAGEDAALVSGRSGWPILKEVRPRVERAVGAGCKALCVTMRGDSPRARFTAGIDWSAIDRLRKGVRVPVVSEGRDEPGRSSQSGAAGVQGLVVSNYAARAIPGVASPIEVLPAIADAVAGRRRS